MGNFFKCFTLEDVDRGLNQRMPLDEIKKAKVFSRTAIPSGRYQVTINMSTRFNRPMPELLNVPDYAGVRIHSGNTAADTDGCLLLGMDCATNIVTNSREAFTQFFMILSQALNNKETVYLTIV
jgi:hypothetical protein